MTGKRSISKSPISQVLKQLPEEDLRQFVEKILNGQDVRAKFLKEFENYFIKDESEDSYLEQIDDAYDDATCEHPYVLFSKMPHLSYQMDDMLETADKFRDKGNFTAAVMICFKVLRNNIEVLNESDDSYGYLGGIMDRAFDSLYALTNPAVCTMDDDGHETFINECMDCIKDKIFDGWDWHLDVYAMLSDLADKEEDYEAIIRTMETDKKLKEDYYLQRAMILKRDLLTKWHGEKAGEEFMMENLHISDFREEAIGHAIENKDYRYAYSLCEDGIRQDEEEDKGLRYTWCHWMLKTAMKDGNKDIIIKYASQLYFDAPFIQCDFYEILQNTVPACDWSDFILKLSEKAKALCNNRYADICVREGWTEKLLEYVRQNGEIRTVRQYQPYLLPKYAGDLVEMYKQYACSLMNTRSRSRGTYREMCNYLKYACDIGGRDKVTSTITDLKIRYRNCRALMEELEKV